MNAALWANDSAHVLDATGDPDPVELQNIEKLLAIKVGKIMWGYDDNCRGYLKLLYQLLLDITRPRWQINNKIVKFRPLDVVE